MAQNPKPQSQGNRPGVETYVEPREAGTGEEPQGGSSAPIGVELPKVMASSPTETQGNLLIALQEAIDLIFRDAIQLLSPMPDTVAVLQIVQERVAAVLTAGGMSIGNALQQSRGVQQQLQRLPTGTPQRQAAGNRPAVFRPTRAGGQATTGGTAKGGRD